MHKSSPSIRCELAEISLGIKPSAEQEGGRLAGNSVTGRQSGDTTEEDGMKGTYDSGPRVSLEPTRPQLGSSLDPAACSATFRRFESKTSKQRKTASCFLGELAKLPDSVKTKNNPFVFLLPA